MQEPLPKRVLLSSDCCTSRHYLHVLALSNHLASSVVAVIERITLRSLKAAERATRFPVNLSVKGILLLLECLILNGLQVYEEKKNVKKESQQKTAVTFNGKAKRCIK